MNRDALALLAAMYAALGWHCYLTHPVPAPMSPLAAGPVIASSPDKERHPLHRRREKEARVGGDVAPDGAPVQIDFPQDLRMHNTGGMGRGGPGTGAGLCVWTSLNHAAIWQHVEPFVDLQQWMTTKPGGGYPEKVDALLQRKCREMGVPMPRYVQVEGDDIEPIKMACKTGRMPSSTYGFSPSGRYGGERISHMVNPVHALNGYFAILDNNYPEQLEWLNESEFKRAYASDGGWTVILLEPGPPPVPHNKRR